MNISVEAFIALALLAFLSEYVSISLGMGYGIILTPILLMVGFKPLQIVPVVLISEFLSGTIAALFHHRFENADFHIGTRDFKIAALLGGCSIIGAVVAVVVAVNISQKMLESVIGCIILFIGIVILLMRRASLKFSWVKIAILGLIAAFNKGISGGGYGPLVTGGQIVSGVPGKNAIGITSLTKAIACIVGFLVYLFIENNTDLSLMSPIVIGAILSAPLATLTVKLLNQENIKLFIGILTTLLGALTLIRIFL